MARKLLGRYLRKRGSQGSYFPKNGWHRKWTYFVGWHGRGKSIRLIAMVDGMVTNEFTSEELESWMSKKDMVVMTKNEILSFFLNDEE